MSAPSNNPLIDDLAARGLMAQATGGDELKAHLNSGMRSVYCGFDPTADSLHIGSLVPLLALKRFQEAGHRPIALVGGATGLIGDPSFKEAERQLNSADLVAEWVERLKPQLSRFLDFDCGENSALLVNNLDWTAGKDLLGFLRDIGKHFSVNAMISKESVRQRIDRDDAGISFTEFSYMILQAYDFAELYQRHGCTMQIGGSDQWGNITAGIDLTRRLHQAQVYGLTLPLVTRADGKKFGKTEKGTVWLSPDKTSPYNFYQFWINTPDSDVYDCLRYFTFAGGASRGNASYTASKDGPSEYSPQNIDSLEKAAEHGNNPGRLQRDLAWSMTALVHGEEGVAGVERISQALFKGEVANLTESDFAQLEQGGLPCTQIESDTATIVELLTVSGLAPSNKRAREFITNGAVQLNGQKLTDPEAVLTRAQSAHGKYLLLKRGKKQFHLLKLLG